MNKEDLIKNQLKKTMGYSKYNGWNNNRTDFGYHSYNMEDISIVGQRNTLDRINKIKNFLNFDNKNIVDFGCNVGAIIHHIPEIKQGIGFDYDEKCIESANEISNILNIKNNHFFTHDFDKNSYEDLRGKIDIKPDLIFLLSIGSWVKSWETLYAICLSYNCDIILETNNDIEGNPQLNFFKNNGCELVLISEKSDDDTTGNFLRKMYLIKHNE